MSCGGGSRHGRCERRPVATGTVCSDGAMVRWVVVRVVLGFTITTVLTACGSGNVLESEAGGPPSFDPMATVSFAAPVRYVTMGVDDQHLVAADSR